MTKNPFVSIIVLNFNGVNFLKTSLPSIQKQTYKNIETIVIDNHSSDSSEKYVKTLKWVKWVQNKKNLGYAQANNVAALQAKGELLFFLNNDTELFPDCIETLVSNYETTSILAPMQLISSTASSKKNIDKFCGMGMDIFGYPYRKNEDTKTKLFYVDGAAFFIGKNDFFDIGMFDEKHFIFFEDIDLSWRAQIMGYKLVRCPKAKLYHYSGGTVTGAAKKSRSYQSSYLRRYLNEKNLIRNILKNYSFPLCLFILFSVLLMHIPEIIILTLIGRQKAALCYFQAYWWNVRNIQDTLIVRKDIQSKRIISDFAILKRVHYVYPKIGVLLKYGVPSFS